MMTKVTYTQIVSTKVEVEVPDRYLRDHYNFEYDDLDRFADLFLITFCNSPISIADYQINDALSERVRLSLIDDLYSEDMSLVTNAMETFAAAYKLADATMEHINKSDRDPISYKPSKKFF